MQKCCVNEGFEDVTDHRWNVVYDILFVYGRKKRIQIVKNKAHQQGHNKPFLHPSNAWPPS